MLDPIMILHPEIAKMPGDYIDNLIDYFQAIEDAEALMKTESKKSEAEQKERVRNLEEELFFKILNRLEQEKETPASIIKTETIQNKPKIF